MINSDLPSLGQLFDAATIPRWLLGGEELATGLFHLPIILEAPSAQKMCHRPEKVVIWWSKVWAVSWMGHELDAFQLPDVLEPLSLFRSYRLFFRRVAYLVVLFLRAEKANQVPIFFCMRTCHIIAFNFAYFFGSCSRFVVLFPVVTQKYANFRFLALHFDILAKFELRVSTTFFVFWTRPWGTSKHRTYSCYITLLGRPGNEDEKFRPKKARELS